MKSIKKFVLTVVAVAAVCLAGCVKERIDRIRQNKGEGTAFVVRISSLEGVTRAYVAGNVSGYNGHAVPNGGTPTGYENYFADADAEMYGTQYGGYPSAEAEEAAFERAVEKMAANARAGGVFGRDGARHVSTAATRAITEGGADDNHIEEITILLFDDVAPHNYIEHIQIPATAISDGSDITRKEFKAAISDGKYRALMLANAWEYINSYFTATGSANLTSKSLADMQNELTFAFNNKWNNEPGSADYKDFPMSSKVIPLEVPHPAATNYEIDLMRALAKVNVGVGGSLSAGSTFSINEIIVCNYNTTGNLVPAEDWGKPSLEASLFNPAAVRSSTGWATGTGTGLSYTITTNGSVDEIFVPEQKAPANNPANFKTNPAEWQDAICLLIEADITVGGVAYGNRWYRINFFKPNPAASNAVWQANILRNYRYEIMINEVGNIGYGTKEEAYGNHPDGLTYSLTAAGTANDREGMNDITFNGQYQLAVNRSIILISGEANAESLLRIYTDYSNGWQIYGINGGGWLSAALDGGTIALPGGGTTTNNTVSTSEVRLTAQQNGTINIRTATIALVAGNLFKLIKVIQFPEDVPIGGTERNIEYVGAFWQANQTGERIIRNMGHTGEWHAMVTWHDGRWNDGDIVLALGDSYDTGVTRQAGENPGDAENYQVSGYATGVSGTDDIVFRIGLKSRYTPTMQYPARYAIVMLSHSGEVEKLFLRQGEAPDYLMRPVDPGTGISSRPNAMMFSPYNLTASTLNTQAGSKGAAPNPAVFTQYPTQAGALFQWANAANTRFAYDAFNSSAQGTWNTTNAAQFWNALEADHETCPESYRRPEDGTIFANSAGNIAGSETRQSLWLNPQTSTTSNIDNSIWGYYADGFFDRRQTVTAPGTLGEANSAVSAGDRNVAYKGTLFFNPTTQASLFFPATGYRTSDAGLLVLAGYTGNYWTGSSVSSDNAWYMGQNNMLSPRVTNMGNSDTKASAYSIRCVYEILITGVTLSRTDGTGNVNIGASAALLATIEPANASGVKYEWQLENGAGNWISIAETFTNIFDAPILLYGVNRYRVIASNGGSSETSNTIDVTGVFPVVGAEDEPDMLMYVGAFWRANQRGERLIRIVVPSGSAGVSNAGPWTASVSWLDGRWNTAAGDGVVLSKARSLDANVNKAGATPGLAENYQVFPASDSTFIFGTVNPGGAIEFRIGLKSTFNAPVFQELSPNYTTSWPARYAIVIITYGEGKVRRLFLRQGQGADFVMRTSEPGTSLVNRPEAKRWTVYNIKDEQHRITTQAQTGYLSATNRAVFVDYPSMGGYLFSAGAFTSNSTSGNVFASPPQNGHAAQPVNQNNFGFVPAQGNSYVWWATGNTINGPELCPTNYRRPGDGSVSAAGAGTVLGAGAVPGSEIRQSLWLNPPSGGNVANTPSPSNANNSVGGIYADGYYDRGVIDQTGTAAGSAGKYTVHWNYYSGSYPPGAAGRADLRVFTASSGRLFFNPETNASLFLPAIGISTATTELRIALIGEKGGYWTRTAYAIGTAGRVSYFDFNIWDGANSTPVVRMNNSVPQAFMPVRCVRE